MKTLEFVVDVSDVEETSTEDETYFSGTYSVNGVTFDAEGGTADSSNPIPSIDRVIRRAVEKQWPGMEFHVDPPYEDVEEMVQAVLYSEDKLGTIVAHQVDGEVRIFILQ